MSMPRETWSKIWRLDIGPRSEQWRIWWSFRTCISVAVMTFLFLYKPTQTTLLENSNPAFAAFVTVLVKDETVGASFWNSWVCILGSLLSTLMCYFVQLGLARAYSLEEGFPVPICLCLLFAAVFILQYVEVPLMGKKLGVSLLATNLIGFIHANFNPKSVWTSYISVLLGCAFGIIGTVFPLPIQYAGTEMQYRLRYHSQVLSSLYHSVTLAWMHQPFKIYKAPIHQDGLKDSNLNTTSFKIALSTRIAGESCNRRLQNKRWRRIRTLFRVLIAFKHAKFYRLSWIHHQARLSKDRYIRMELIKYLEDELDMLMKKNNEAKFGPNRSLAIRIFSRYLLLIRRLLTILYRLEQLVVQIEQQAADHYIYRQFFYSPTFREKLWNFVQGIVQSIEGLAHICVRLPSIKATMSIDYTLPTELISIEVVHHMANMIAAKRELDEEYFLIRRQLYYDLNKPLRKREQSQSLDTSRAFSNEEEQTEETISRTTTAHMTRKSLQRRNSLPTEFDDHHETERLPLVNSVMFNMNSFLFLLDTTSDLITQFWDIGELKTIQEDMVLYYEKLQNNPSSHFITERCQHIAIAAQSRCWKWWNTCRGVLTDLIPSQRHLFFLSYSAEKKQYVWNFTPVIITRLKSSLVVSLSMTLAAIYGIYADRPQPFLAAFTIAYLAGGSAAGMNIMTCINRAAGTVIACVYAIIVIYIYNTYIFQSSEVAQGLLIGISLVLFQFPCTYVRSYNLYSYSGTVAGFTAALLLIDPRQLSPDQSINRIIDTYVGVAIYIAIELILSAQFIEDMLLNDMKAFVEGIERRFSHFHAYFERFQLVSQRLRALSHQQHKAMEEPTPTRPSPFEIMNHSHDDVEETEFTTVKRINKRKLSVDDSAIDYSRIYDDLEKQSTTNKQHDLRSESMMATEKEITADEFFALFSHRRMTIAPSLRFELESLHTVINRQRLLIPFYDAEPKLLGPPSLPSRLIEECLYWQNQAMKNLQVMYWVVEACDGSRDPTSDEFILFMNHQYITRDRKRVKQTTISAQTAAAIKQYKKSLHHHRNSIITSFAAPDYETFLLPLQEQFVQVESFVSTSIVFLSSAILQLKQHNVAKQAFYETTNHNRSDPLGLLSAIHMKRFPDEMMLEVEVDPEAPALETAGLSRPILMNLETSGNAVQKLFKDYQLILTGLQSKIVEKETSHGAMQNTDVKLHIASNKEIKTVNALLSSTYDLVAALKGLAAAISRLQASRDIRITQNARHLD